MWRQGPKSSCTWRKPQEPPLPSPLPQTHKHANTRAQKCLDLACLCVRRYSWPYDLGDKPASLRAAAAKGGDMCNVVRLRPVVGSSNLLWHVVQWSEHVVVRNRHSGREHDMYSPSPHPRQTYSPWWQRPSKLGIGLLKLGGHLNVPAVPSGTVAGVGSAIARHHVPRGRQGERHAHSRACNHG